MEDDPKVLELLRRATPEQKLITAARLFWAAWEWKAAALRSFHPDWTEERIKKEVRHAILTAKG